jgi:hypothetical protein
MYSEDERIKSTILYYPTIDIPNTDWLRKVLLYWDEIGSIVPRNYQNENSITFSPEVSFLMSEGVFRPFDPLRLIGNLQLLQEFEQEFLGVIESEPFQRLITNKKLKLASRIHMHKIVDLILEKLEERELAKRSQSSPWIKFEFNTAQAYMSLLAKYLSRIDSQATIPGTSKGGDIFQDLIYRSPEQSGTAGISASLLRILPMPRQDVTFEDILDFKRRRNIELMRFRLKIHEFQKELQSAENHEHIIQIVQKRQHEIQLGLEDLMPRFIEDKLRVVFGSLQSILQLPIPTLLGAGIVAADITTDLINIPLKYEIGGMLITGGIQIGDYLIKDLIRTRDEINKSQLSYLVSAQSEGIF